LPVGSLILQKRNLIVFTFSGMVTLQETMDTLSACARQPEYQPWMRQICDLSRMTGYEDDFIKFLKMQAQFAEDMQINGQEMIVMFYAPTAPGQKIAQMARRSWEEISSVVMLIQTDEAEALSMLGLRERSMAELASATV
jgi:hypothetical protein